MDSIQSSNENRLNSQRLNLQPRENEIKVKDFRRCRKNSLTNKTNTIRILLKSFLKLNISVQNVLSSLFKFNCYVRLLQLTASYWKCCVKMLCKNRNQRQWWKHTWYAFFESLTESNRNKQQPSNRVATDTSNEYMNSVYNSAKSLSVGVYDRPFLLQLR